jgi:hypothetical protein
VRTSAKVGDLVAVEFIDHCEGGRDLMECIVYGRLIYRDAEKVTVCSWELPRDLDDPYNNTPFNLFAPAVTKVRVLEKQT